MSGPATPGMGPTTPGLGPTRSKGGYPVAGSQSPNLGPVGTRGRAGSVSGGAWQLVEIAGNRPATITRSNQASPAVHLLESTDADDGWTLDGSKAPPAEPSGDENRPPSRVRKNWAEQEMGDEWHSQQKETFEEAGGEGDDFEPNAFLGEWLDNLGHQILVTPSERWGGNRRGRRGDTTSTRLVFTANLQKPGVPDKRFTIALDRSSPPQWRCGNGSLVREESSMEAVSWKAEDGRISQWTRPVPEGPVYFDAPPTWGMNSYEGMADWGMMGEHGGCGNMQMESMAFNPDAPEFVPSMPTPSPSPAMKPMSAPTTRSRASPKMTPMPSPAIRPGWGRTPTPSPMIKPMASPLLQALHFPGIGPAAVSLAPAPQLLLSEESPDATVSGARMEWCLPDNWGKLGRFPKDFCISSPMFGMAEDAANMQLAFYPNGSREAEPGHCTVQLTRGPESAGIKFEFTVNGRSIGPKVCLGRRYLGDYLKPCDDAEESKGQKVVVAMQVLEIFGSTAGGRRA